MTMIKSSTMQMHREHVSTSWSCVVAWRRFVFHELIGTKIDNKVTFPLENLDLSDYISGPRLTSASLRYDLQSFVCHFGGRCRLAT